jgi:hypothetical protein
VWLQAGKWLYPASWGIKQLRTQSAMSITARHAGSEHPCRYRRQAQATVACNGHNPFPAPAEVAVAVFRQRLTVMTRDSQIVIAPSYGECKKNGGLRLAGWLVG